MKKYGKIFCLGLALLLVCRFPALATETNLVTNGDFETETALESWTGADTAYTVSANGGIDNSAYLQVSTAKTVIKLYQSCAGITAGQTYKLSFYFKGEAAYPYILMQHVYRQNGVKGEQINLFNKVTARSSWRQTQAKINLENFTDTGSDYYNAKVGENEVMPWGVTTTEGWEYREYIFEVPEYTPTYPACGYYATTLYLGAIKTEAEGYVGYDNVCIEPFETTECTLFSENKTEIKTVLSGDETLQIVLQRPDAATTSKVIACLYGYNEETPILEDILYFGNLTSGAGTVSFDDVTLQTTIHAFPGMTQSIPVPALTEGKRYALSVFALSDIGTLEPICEKVTLKTATE